jgi:hypothetical protein
MTFLLLAISVTDSFGQCPNLITNPGFESGNTGFSSQFTYQSNLTPANTYYVGYNANSYHPSFSGVAHSGSMMMIANGTDNNNSLAIVYQTNVSTVVPNAIYTFSMWCREVYDGSDPTFRVYINDVHVYTATFGFAWTNFVFNWIAPAGITSANIKIREYSVGSNNDYAIDDLLFAQGPATPPAPTTNWTGDHYICGAFNTTAPSSAGASYYRLCRSNDNTGGCAAWVNSGTTYSPGTVVTVSGADLPGNGAFRYYYWYAWDNCGNMSLNSDPTYIRMDQSPPTHDGVTVSSNCWNTDGNNTYAVTTKVSDPMGIGGSTYGTMVLINYQGTYAGYYGGYYAWNTAKALLDAAGYTADQSACAGGGWVGKHATAYGQNAATLVSGSTSVNGTQRTVTFNIRPNSTFPALTANDISSYAQDACGYASGWVNWDLNFSSASAGYISGTVSSVCPGNPVSYTRSGGGGTFQYFEYQWNGNGGSWSGSWGTTNPYTWTSCCPTNTLYVRAVSLIGSCYLYSAPVSTYINPPPAITGQPASPAAVCAGIGAPSFTVTATGAGLTYLWQESTNGGGAWNTISNCTGIYSGCTSPTLTLTNPTAGMNGFKYRCVVSGTCTPQAITDGNATLTVNALPTFTTVQNNVSCYGGNDGSISMTITGGVNNSPYYFSVNNGTDLYTALYTGSYPNFVLTGLSANITYKIRVKDKNGCESAFCTTP